MEGILVHVERRNGNAEAGPDAVVVDAPGHHVDQNFVLADLPGGQQLNLHRAFRRAMALLADRPGMHLRGNVTERGDFPDGVMVLESRWTRGFGESGHGVSAHSKPRRHSAVFDAAPQYVGFTTHVFRPGPISALLPCM